MSKVIDFLSAKKKKEVKDKADLLDTVLSPFEKTTPSPKDLTEDLLEGPTEEEDLVLEPSTKTTTAESTEIPTEAPPKFDFKDILLDNKQKQQRLQRDRDKANEGIKRSHRLSNKKGDKK